MRESHSFRSIVSFSSFSSFPSQFREVFIYLFILKTSVAAVCWNTPTSLSNTSNHTAVPLIRLSWPWLCIAVSLRCAVTALLIIIQPIWATRCRWSYNLITKWHLGVPRSQSYTGWLSSVTQVMTTLDGVLMTRSNLVVKASCGCTFCETCVGTTQSLAVAHITQGFEIQLWKYEEILRDVLMLITAHLEDLIMRASVTWTRVSLKIELLCP